MAINICEPWHEKVVKALVTQLCPTLCNPIDYSPPGSSAHGFLQARILELVAIPFSKGSSQPRGQTQVSCIAAGFFTIWATRKAQALASTISLNPYQFSSVQFSCSVMSDSLQPNGPQHASPPCPSPSPRVYSNSCPLSWCCLPTISSSVVPFSSHLQSFPASGSFQMSQVAKVLEFQLEHLSFQWIFRADFL